MKFRNLIGLILMIAAVAFGLWAGVWWAFIGGIVQVVHAAQGTPVDALAIALGVARVCCAGFIGVIAFLTVGSVGAVLAAA